MVLNAKSRAKVKIGFLQVQIMILSYDAGTDIKTIQFIMGQSDYKTTADRYCHPREEKKRGVVLSVGEMLSK